MGTNNTKQAAWISIGSLCSFGVGIVSSMILSRYFNKADYGTYKQVIYVYSTMVTLFTLGLPKAYSYFLPRVEINQAKSLIRKLTRLFFFLGFVFTAVLFLGSELIADLLNNSQLGGAIRLFSVVPMLTLPAMGLEGILSTYRKTQFLTLYTVTTRTFMLCCVALPVMLFGFGYIQAIWGFVISSTVNCALALKLKNYPVRDADNKPCTIKYKEIFQFSIPLLFANLWGMVILHCDQFFVSRYFGAEVFAEFSNGFMDLPFVGMILGACATVLSPVFSRMSHEQVDFKKEVYPLWISVFEKTAMLIYPLIIYCIVFADIVMVSLYGSQYETSTTYFRIKLLADFFMIITYAPLLINTGRVKFYQGVIMWCALLIVPMEYIVILLFNNPIAVAYVSVSFKIGRILVMLGCIAHMFGVPMYQIFPFRLILRILLPSIVILFIIRQILIIVGIVNTKAVLSLVISFSAYLLIFVLYTWVSHIDYTSIIKPLLRK